jgi:hypothetical protein
MNTKTLILPLANAALYLITCAVIGTGLLLEFRLDEEDEAVRLLGMGADDWGEIHLAIALGFAALTVFHLLLNLAWIKASLTKAKWVAPMLAAGIGLVAVLLFWPADHQPAHGGKTVAHHQKDED